MFESLKKKLKSWLGAEEKNPKKKAKKEKETSEKKKQKKESQSVEKIKKQAEKIAQEVPLKFEVGKLKYEPDEEAIKETLKEENKGFFARLKNKLVSAKITEQDFEDIFCELEIALLENNVAINAVDSIKKDLKKSLIGKEVRKGSLQQHIVSALASAIENVLAEPPDFIQLVNKKNPFVILFFGINGSGKTTTVAKIARFLQKNSISCVMAAADTFRAASIEQIEAHAKNLNIPLVKHAYGSDPAAVAFDAIAYAKKNRIKAVLIDTAGRMYTKENLMKEMEKIVRISQPDLKLFIGESIAGNDVIEQARTFNESIGIDGIILSKADVDDKGGAALSVSHVTGKPIFFLGTGQNYSDLKPFKKEDIIKQLGLN